MVKKPSPFDKRVKRRIVGREHSFFAACSPGLKKICHAELQALGLPEDRLKIIKGGIEFKAKLTICAGCNLHLRSPLRILMRLSRFKANSFEKLEKKVAAIDWILYLPINCSLKFNVTVRKSRLYHSDAIAQRCEKIILNRLKTTDGYMDDHSSEQTIHVRAENDNFTLSLDCSGTHLFKRGIKEKVHKAPLRENLAFAMLHWLNFSAADMLIDPMCGSGTFSIEAAMMKMNIPPGFYRNFAFESWPGVSKKSFQYLKHQAENKFLTCSKPQIFASDIDRMAIHHLEYNIQKFDALKVCIDLSTNDFFSIDPAQLSFQSSPSNKGVILLNPPYGKRLGEKKDTPSFFCNIGKKLTADFKGWRLGIILPSKKCTTSLGLKLSLKPIYHGGLDLFAGIGVI